MNKKLLLLPLASLVLLSSCLTSLHNLVNYQNVISDNRVTGNWQYGDLAVRIEPVPTSIFVKNLSSSVVSGELPLTLENGQPAKLNAEIKLDRYTKQPVGFNGEVTSSKKDSNKINVNGELKKSAYDSEEDSLLYSKSYVVSFTKNNYHFYMVCCLTRIGEYIYADLEPLSAEPVNKPTATDIHDLFDAGNYMSSHSIARVIIRNDQLEFHILNGDFIRDQLTNGFAAIKYEADALFGTTLITSSAEQLRQFLLKYGKDERLYSPENTVILKKIVS